MGTESFPSDEALSSADVPARVAEAQSGLRSDEGFAGEG